LKQTAATALILATLTTATLADKEDVPAREEAPGHIIVFKKHVNAKDAANDLKSHHGLKSGRVYQHAIKAVFVPTDLPPQALAALEKNPNIAYVEKNGIGELIAQPTPTGIDRVDAEKAVTIDGIDDLIDVDIAMIDSGIDPTHPDLNVNHAMSVAFKLVYEGKGKKRRQVLVESHDVNDWADWHGHGTLVAGIAAAIDNDIGTVGVAPGARVAAVQAYSETNSTTALAIAAIDYVAANADTFEVASMSVRYNQSNAINDAVANLTAAGVVFVCGAGNDGEDTSNGSPSSAPSAITVSAIADSDGLPGGLGPDTSEVPAGTEWEGQTKGADDTRAVFSNYGPLVDIAAPGVDIYSTWLDGGYVVKSGTSTATPHVSGAIALYIAHNGRDRDDNGVINGNDVALMELLVKDTGWQIGDYEYFSGDTDGYPEPLLNVDNLLDFQIDQLPTVSITSPSDGATLSDAVAIQANASDDYAVTQVEFFVDGTSLGIDADPSDGYSLNWDSTLVSDGSHEISAVATDDALQNSTSSVTVSIDNIDSAPTAIAGSNQTVQDSDGNGSESVTLNGSGSSDDRAIASYQWSEGTNILSTEATFTQDLQVGVHTIKLIVTDDIGKTAQDTVVITVEEAPATGTQVSVASIAISGYGGKNGNNHLQAIATLQDNLGDAVVGAVIEADLYRDSTKIKTASTTTDSTGSTLLFNEKSIAAGRYSVVITKITITGMTFDGVTPTNEFRK
jgi:subtilisin family serine protease